MVIGSRKQGVQTSGDLSGCSRAGFLEAVAALCAHCWVSCSSRVSEPAAGSTYTSGRGLREDGRFSGSGGGLRKAPTELLGRKEGSGRQWGGYSHNYHPLSGVGGFSVFSQAPESSTTLRDSCTGAMA